MTEEVNASSEPQIDFSAFVLSLAANAVMYLDAEELSQGHASQKTLARQNIDILLMLKEKTEGNLDEEESTLLAQVIRDLQLRFVQDFK